MGQALIMGGGSRPHFLWINTQRMLFERNSEIAIYINGDLVTTSGSKTTSIKSFKTGDKITVLFKHWGYLYIDDVEIEPRMETDAEYVFYPSSDIRIWNGIAGSSSSSIYPIVRINNDIEGEYSFNY